MKKIPILSELQGDLFIMEKNKAAHYMDDSKISSTTDVKLTTIIESSINILKQEKIIWKSVGAGESIDYLYC
ncbi:hypothetical protein [Bacillus luti]|uniref:Uncharacterized protein n=1 Tax=Bacillus luti TaxID=2026191 RepID=A0A7V7S2F3_9BACI|nr:hypothetical protein [Bacillus luti]KAB2439567.1 hypothetical protein F8163_29140 [Bacillus luti]